MNVESYASDEHDSSRKKPANMAYSFALRLKIRDHLLVLPLDIQYAMTQAITSELICIKRL